MINPLNKKQMERLFDSIAWSNRQLDSPRKKRIESIKESVGYHYYDNSCDHRNPVNIYALALQIYVRLLSPQSPRALITSKSDGLRSTAANMTFAVNQIPDEINLDSTLRRFVLEAMHSIGILKCGLHSAGSMYGNEYGKSFVDNIGLDDYFFDATSKSWDSIDYEGNDYWLDFEDVMDSKGIDKAVRAKLKPDDYTIIGDRGQDRAESLTQSETPKTFKEKIWLRDIWLPKERLMLTCGVKDREVLSVVEWETPGSGPYPKLGFNDVPGNIMPLPPTALWRDIHDLGNAMWRKLGKQGRDQKTVYGFQGDNPESATRFAKAKDGDGIGYKGQPPHELKTGGVDAKTLAFAMQCRDISSYIAGNIDSLGGLARQTETVGQDRLMGEAANAQMRDMVARNIKAIKEVFRALAYYEWTDPVRIRTLEKPVPATDKKIKSTFGPKDKKGKFEALDIDIDVYSLQDDSPGLKLQRLTTILERFIIPMYPMIQAQGGSVDVQEILKDVARYSNSSEIGNWVLFTQQPQVSDPASSSTPSPAPSSEEKAGGAGMTQRGASAELQKELLASG